MIFLREMEANYIYSGLRIYTCMSTGYIHLLLCILYSREISLHVGSGCES